MFTKQILLPLAAGAALLSSAAFAAAPATSFWGGNGVAGDDRQFSSSEHQASTAPHCPSGYYATDGECRYLEPGEAPA